jgi:hypothetical protein
MLFHRLPQKKDGTGSIVMRRKTSTVLAVCCAIPGASSGAISLRRLRSLCHIVAHPVGTVNRRWRIRSAAEFSQHFL